MEREGSQLIGDEWHILVMDYVIARLVFEEVDLLDTSDSLVRVCTADVYDVANITSNAYCVVMALRRMNLLVSSG